jgi:hypothetical protein
MMVVMSPCDGSTSKKPLQSERLVESEQTPEVMVVVRVAARV